MKNIIIGAEKREKPNDGDTEMRAVCQCGYVSGFFPWADYLAEVAEAHAASHRAEGRTVLLTEELLP